MESSLVRRKGIPFEAVPAAGVHGVGVLALPQNLFQLARGVIASSRILHSFRPDALFFTGGFVGIPMSLAGWRRSKALFVPDIAPALAARWISRLADVIAVATEDSRRYYADDRRVVVTGYPVRLELRHWARSTARRVLDLPSGEQVLLVFGGSRGARSINEALWDVLPGLLERAWVLHITGKLAWSRVDDVRAAIPQSLADRYRAYPYLHEEMGPALAAADLVVSRAGAATMGEYPSFGLPAVLVPYPHAWRYQEQNAAYMQERGAALRLRDEDLGEALLPTILGLLGDRPRLQAMSKAAREMASPDAAQAIADEIHRLASGESGAHG
jgi:UDP-N-acetylglucosamine--N-acetylmuramyl-(pentapeptide) pyrophosphoryl-undecaprenol N-acetylglucosamine transferase